MVQFGSMSGELRATSNKQQATSNKQQAASSKQQAASSKHWTSVGLGGWSLEFNTATENPEPLLPET